MFWKACSLSRTLTNHLCYCRDDGFSVTNSCLQWLGPPPLPQTGPVHWAREEQFQSHTHSTHQILRPNLSQQMTLKQASPTISVHAPCFEKGQEQITKALTDTKREELPNISDTRRTKGPLFCHIQMRSFQDRRWQQGANKRRRSDHSFAFLKIFPFNRALHRSVQKLN